MEAQAKVIQQEHFQLSSRARMVFLVMIVLGVIGLAWGFIAGYGGEDTNHASRIWSNILINGYFFSGIALCGTFLVAAHQVGYGGWHTVMRRIPEAFGAFIPYAFAFIVLIIIGLWLDWHGIYDHWAHAPESDEIVHGRGMWDEKWFFTLRIFLYYGLWIVLQHTLRKMSLAEDVIAPLSNYKKHKAVAALFLVVFAVSESMISWDLIMSIDAHWYSTLFGWYNFANYMCASLAFMIIIMIYMKSRGFLKLVAVDHIHDMGKLMFGFSIFYTYLWFAQFMLIWYANIPETTVYYVNRFSIPWFNFLFLFVFVMNFILPILILMSRGAKRSMPLILTMSVVIIFGHYLDTYLMVSPGANAPHQVQHADDSHGADYDTHHSQNERVLYADNAHDKTHLDTHDGEIATDAHHADSHDAHGEQGPKLTYATFGLIEILIFIGFVGGFLLVVLSVLSKMRLVPINNPFLKESINHHF